jgi:ankyrin repeat protein
MTPRSEKNNQPSSSNQALINNRITSLNKDASKTILNSPRIQSQQEKKQQEPCDSQTILKELHFAISNLQKKRTPEFNEIEIVCQKLKNAESILLLEGSQPELSKQCDQLRSQLPQFFNKIQQHLDYQEALGNKIDIETIHTLCIGLSALANPLNDSFLSQEQCVKYQEKLTHISANFCTMLIKPLQHGSLHSGKLLNILNWYSRGMKKDLLNRHDKAIKQIFQLTLTRLQNWANGSADADWLTSKQLSKCMVQLNTMIHLKIINIENNAEGKSNRLAWSETVHGLCQYFLSNDAWLNKCNIIELINVTNTLKDGIEQKILNVEDVSLRETINYICERIYQQSFTLNNYGELNSLTNCCNFMRCLYEHKLVGNCTSLSGLAMQKLVSTFVIYKSDEKYNANPQAVINIASFIKSVSRWIQAQENSTTILSKSTLSEAVIAILKICKQLCQKEKLTWLESSVNSSGLLSALDYFNQNKLIPSQQQSSLIFILRSVLDNIKNWHQDDISSVSILLALRTLASLESKSVIFQSLQKSGSLNKSLPTLLNYLKRNNKNKTIIFNNEEKLATLETIHMGIQIDIIFIDEYQNLLQHLLKTNHPVSIQKIESAILQFNGTLKQTNIVEIEENSEQQDEDKHLAELPSSLALAKRGPTYRGTTTEKQTEQKTLIHTNSLLKQQDWTSVPFKFSQNTYVGNISTININQLPVETAATIPTITVRKEKNNLHSKSITNDKNNNIEAEKNKVKEYQHSSKNKSISRQQAKSEWFNLLKKEKSSSLKELQKLAALYPELISLQEESKKKKLGANAMYYAITLGKFEFASWLTKQNNPIAGQSFGDFMESVMHELTVIEDKHVQAINYFVSSQVKMAESEGKIILMSPMQLDYAKEIPEVKNILEKYDLLTSFKYFLSYGLISNHRNRNLNKKNDMVSSYISTGMSIENFNMREFLNANYEKGATNLITLLTYSPIQEIEFCLNFIDDKNDFIHSNIPDSNAIFYAIRNESKGRFNIISLLLNSVSDKDKLIYASNMNGMNTLSYAIEFNLHEMVTILLDHASNPDHLAQTSHYAGLSSLMHAAETGNAKIIKTLLGKVKNKNSLAQLADANGNTALMFAVARKRTEAIKVLLNETPDSDLLLSQMTLRGETAYDIAVKNNYHTMLDILRPVHQREKSSPSSSVNKLEEINKNLIPDQLEENFHILFGAINDGNIALAKLIVRSNIDIEKIIHKKNVNGTSLLMVAVKNNNIEMIDLLLQTTSDKDSLILDSSREGINAFMIAIKEGYIEATEKLFRSVSDKEKLIYAEVKDGSNALMIAIKYNRLGIAKLILQNVRNPSFLAETKMHSGLTSLMIAAGLGNILGLRLLLVFVKDPSALIKIIDTSNNSALFYAVEGGYLNAVKELLNWMTDKKSLLTQINQDGETAYTTALKYNQRHLLSLLDPNS